MMKYYDHLVPPPEKDGGCWMRCYHRLFGEKEETDEFTEYELADLVDKINDGFPEDIESQHCIKSIIDY